VEGEVMISTLPYSSVGRDEGREILANDKLIDPSWSPRGHLGESLQNCFHLHATFHLSPEHHKFHTKKHVKIKLYI
jgi:hypothetical protein